MMLSLLTHSRQGHLVRGAEEMSLPLVACGRDGQLLGAPLGMPSSVLFNLIDAAPEGDPTKRQVQALLPMATVAKIKAVAVDLGHQGLGLGTVLVRRAVQVYKALGFFLVYGQFATDTTLERFYRRQGFDVLDEGAGVDVGFLLAGISRYLTAGPDERMFYQWIKE